MDLTKEEKFNIRSPRLDEFSADRIPATVRYLYYWFSDLNGARQSSGFGPAAFSFSEIKAWSELKGTRPAPWEIDTLKALDGTWRRVWSEVHDKSE